MRHRTVFPAKITYPDYLDIFPRKRLFSLLDKCRNYPVTWICGPPGSGKTVLVSSYIKTRGNPCLWYQVDGGDGDAATFFYYMGLAAKKAAPHRKKRLPLLTPEYIPSLSAFTRRYFEELYSCLKPGSLLVFDNYQEVSEGSLFHQVIRDGLAVIPPGINVICISRIGPPPPLSKMRVSQLMEVLGWDELRLTPEESTGVIRTQFRGRLSKGAAEEVHRKTNGWAAGLVVLSAKFKQGELDIESLKKVTVDTLSDYFSSEIFRTIDRNTQEFLLKT